jgi:hypothetical protein
VQYAADACPPDSVYGFASATTPILDHPLHGRLYLRESAGRYPDLAIDLQGQFRLPLIGRIETPRNGIRLRFDSLPDLPLSRLKLVLTGGKRGLLVNSEGLCRRNRRATLSITAHNGVRRPLHPKADAVCGPLPTG